MKDKNKSTVPAPGRSLRFPALLTLAVCTLAAALVASPHVKTSAPVTAQNQKMTTTTVADTKYGKDGTLETTSDEKFKVVREVWKDKDGNVREIHTIEYNGNVATKEQWVFSTAANSGVGYFVYYPLKETFQAGAPVTDTRRVDRAEVEKWMESIEKQFAKDGTIATPYKTKVNDDVPKLPISTEPNATPGYEIDTTSSDGLFTATFTTPHGKIDVNLTDDLAAGDTLSGTVEERPTGKTENERNQNQSELNGYVFELEQQQTRVAEKTFARKIPIALTTADRIIRLLRNGHEVARVEVPISSGLQAPLNGFVLPTGGQQGRLLQIKGPCNGLFALTDFVKIGGTIIRALAESPRKQILRDTSDVLGPTKIECHENDKVAECPFRNLGIKLSADKLSLLKGETTKLHVQVLGLAGINQDVPLDLVNQSPEIVSMEGGAEQHIVIHPKEVAAGTHQTDRALTGITRGPFVITGTVRWTNVCIDGQEVMDGFDGAVSDDRGNVSRQMDDDYEACGPGCVPPVNKGGDVHCVQQGECAKRGEGCECNLFEAPQNDKKKAWKWVAGPFPAKWKKTNGMDYLCQCTRKK